MAKAPSDEAVEAAFKHAMAGRGGPLAKLVKSFSTEDLAAAFSRHPVNLVHAVCWVAGWKQEREENVAERRKWRKELRGERRS